MSKGLRNYPEEVRNTVVRRRLASLTSKDFKPGLGTLAALEYDPAVTRRAVKAKLDKDNK